MNGDRRAKQVVLISSLITIVLLCLAAAQENVFSEWRMHQRRYARLLRKKATDDKGRLIADAYRIELQQIVVPPLNAFDRCVSCHRGVDDPRMANEPNPYKAHPADLFLKHPVDQYGCVICHQGQGRATSWREAKGEGLHWDYPLLPTGLVQSSCGICHDPTSLRGAALGLARGRKLFLENGCQSCHKLEGVGGLMGPALDGVGSKKPMAFPFANVKGEHTLANWLKEHFRDPQKVVSSSRMKSFRLNDSEIQALVIYMLSLQKSDLPRAYLPPDRIEAEYERLHRKALSATELYKRYCVNCHGEGRIAHFDPILQRYVPAIRNRDFLATASDSFIRATIRDGRPGRDMPAWKSEAGGLMDEEINNLVAYLRADQMLSEPPAVSRGDVARGEHLFKRNCMGCHGLDGAGKYAPSLANAVFQAAATDGYIKATIANGRRKTAMPGFVSARGAQRVAKLEEADLDDLVAYVRSLRRK